MKVIKLYKSYLLELAFKIPWIVIGSMVAAISLEVILIPNGLFDGGVTGISMILSDLFGFSLSFVLFILNIPFVLLGYLFLGKRFAFSATLGILSLVLSTNFLEGSTSFLFGHSLLVMIMGGILLGVGIGIVLRNGGALDGTDVLAILISNRTSFSVGEVIFAINILIFLGALVIVGLQGALISTITYFIATTVVDMVKDK